jgi:hypothetical protein
MFKAQFGKRRTFYRKNNYRIRSVCSTEYRGFADMAHWKIVFEPRRGHAQALVETTEDDEEDEDAPPPPPAVCMLSLGEDEVV